MDLKDATKTKLSASLEFMNPRERPPELPFRQRLSKFLHNKDKGKYLGRTPESWAKIILFYLIFYGVLAVLCGFFYFVFQRTIDPRVPKWKLDESVIGTNPGLGFRPMPSIENVQSTLIQFAATKESYEYWVNSTRDFLSVYKKQGTVIGRGANIQTCDYTTYPEHGKVCDFDIRDWFPCTEENKFGYHKSSPCVFLKLNKIYNWVPQFYNNTAELPENMPKKLKEDIEKVDPKSRDNVWVSCEGETPADKENIGPISTLPKGMPGFPGFYFPYENSEGYLSPLVAFHFEDPAKGILINVECKAWAKNIHHSRKDRLGSVHFELLIDAVQ